MPAAAKRITERSVNSPNALTAKSSKGVDELDRKSVLANRDRNPATVVRIATTIRARAAVTLDML
jgi:hypothetical protein